MTNIPNDTAFGDCGPCYWRSVYRDPDNLSFFSWWTNITGVLAFLLSIAMTVTVVSTNLRHNRFYMNLLNYTIAVAIHRGLPLLFKMARLKTIDRCIMSDVKACKFFAFWDNMFSVYEMESVSQICIERYIFLKYTFKGKKIPTWHNYMFSAISFGLALIYSSMPFIGFGRYCKDFTCRYCALDLLVTDRSSYKFTVVFHFLQNLKPLIAIASSMASYILFATMKNATHSTTWLGMGHMAAYLPLAALKTTILASQRLNPYQDLPVDDFEEMIRISAFCELWSAPLALSLFLLNDSYFVKKMKDRLYFWRKRVGEWTPVVVEEMKRE